MAPTDPEPMIFLSAPDVGPVERAAILAAFDSGWVAPVGPDLDAFEAEMAAFLGGGVHAVALSSGTAALHLALVLHGIGASDDVLVPSLTFAATAFAVRHAGARPCFVDSDTASWNLDVDLVAEELGRRAGVGELPAAVMPVDLYGQCADHVALTALCRQYDVALIVDAAEALGAARGGRPAGSTGDCAALSFNGNKILTTSGGGMFLSADEQLADRARYLAAQARQRALHYEHTEVGFNYRMSNLLAALGRAQLSRLPSIIERRAGFDLRYRETLGSIEGVSFQPVPTDSRPNHWLTVITLDVDRHGSPHTVCAALAERNIEARPAWKPMHQQPVFAGAPMLGGSVADAVYATGLCLPTGSGMTDTDLDRVLDALVDVLR